jgi:membrane protein DedA with SNARE-associated domain
MAMTAALFPVTTWALPAEIAIPINGAMVMVSPMICYLCIVAGLWGGCLIGFITGTQFTCFTSTKVQTLTPEELLHQSTTPRTRTHPYARLLAQPKRAPLPISSTASLSDTRYTNILATNSILVY